MKCKCNNIIPPGRVNLGFSVCVSCSTVESYGCAPLINHKTGNSIQIMSSSDAAKIAKMTQRRGYGTMLCQLLYTNAGVQVNTRLMVMWERTVLNGKRQQVLAGGTIANGG